MATTSMQRAGLTGGMVLADRFELVRRLGAGGLAEVWAAQDRVTGASVAVKVLHGHLAGDEGLRERFRREVAVTRGLVHPNIVRVFELHEHEGRPFFALELLSGESLAQRLARGPVDRVEAVRLGKEIALALLEAHQQGVVHRDLKPHNVFLCASEKGQPPKVKLLDFGLARAAGMARLTAQSTVLGTPGYLAPEVLAGAEADPRADLYALGAILFELFSGRRAFSALDALAALRQKAEPAPSPRAVEPAVLPVDDELVRRLLEPDPDRRFLDASQVLRALDGETFAPPMQLPVTLVRGNFDVVIRHRFGKWPGAALNRVMERLGLPRAKPGVFLDVLVSGKRILIEHTSRASADEVAAACRAEGIAVTVEASPKVGKLRSGLRRLLANTTLTVGLALTGTFIAAGNLAHEVSSPQRVARMVAASNATGRELARITHIRETLQQHPYLLWDVTDWLLRHFSIFPLVTWMVFSFPLLVFAIASLALNAQPIGRKVSPSLWPRWFVRRHSAAVASLMAIAVTAGSLWFEDHVDTLIYGPNPKFAIPFSLMLLLALFQAVGGWLILRARPGHDELPTGDATALRLLTGISRRLTALQARAAKSPADGTLLEDLLKAAQTAWTEARRLAANVDIEGGLERDRRLARILVIAAALDDALSATGLSPELSGRLYERLKTATTGETPAMEGPAQPASALLAAPGSTPVGPMMKTA
ncbi:MAG: serine/threonine protein kinase [Deltaproteobacteria bacterium]|nr:serine/threonine protein kinase [Deltaproteobacteria bacterium]